MALVLALVFVTLVFVPTCRDVRGFSLPAVQCRTPQTRPTRHSALIAACLYVTTPLVLPFSEEGDLLS